MDDYNLAKVPSHLRNKYFNPLIVLVLFLSCTPQEKHSRTISENMLYGEWVLVDGNKQINYPYIEFLKDSSAILHSRADTIYRFTFFIRNDSLYLVDIYGKKHVNRIKEFNNNTITFDGIADIRYNQTYKR